MQIVVYTVVMMMKYSKKYSEINKEIKYDK